MKQTLDEARAIMRRNGYAATSSAELWGWAALAAVILALACLTGCACDRAGDAKKPLGMEIQ